jgi:hypothetical protein
MGRPLLSEEEVHHKDYNKQNNDPSNLQVLTAGEHAAVTATDMQEWRPISKKLIQDQQERIRELEAELERMRAQDK